MISATRRILESDILAASCQLLPVPDQPAFEGLRDQITVDLERLPYFHHLSRAGYFHLCRFFREEQVISRHRRQDSEAERERARQHTLNWTETEIWAGLG